MKKTNRKILKILGAIIAIALIILLGIGASYFLDNKQYSKTDKNITIPIFVYHHIVEKIDGPDYMQTAKETFEQQMQGLMNLGYQAISYSDLISYEKGEKKLPNKVFVLSFDDGGEDNYTTLFPIIKQYHLPIAINIVDDRVGSPGYLTWEQIKEMSESELVSVYSHGKAHIESYKVTDEQFVQDIKEAYNHICEKTSKPYEKVYTYPYGIFEEQKIELLKQEGFTQNLTDNKVNQSKDLDLSRLHREYPLRDSVSIILLKTFYRQVRYGS